MMPVTCCTLSTIPLMVSIARPTTLPPQTAAPAAARANRPA